MVLRKAKNLVVIDESLFTDTVPNVDGGFVSPELFTTEMIRAAVDDPRPWLASADAPDPEDFEPVAEDPYWRSRKWALRLVGLQPRPGYTWADMPPQ